MFQRTELPAGPRVISARLPGSRSVAVAAYVLAGSRLESSADAGVAHFMEHLTFKGTRDFPTSRAISEAIEGVGGSANAATDRESTVYWARVPRREARKRAEELLDRVGLAHRMGHRPGDLSGGQQQRVAVARAIALDPPLILADEPTAHLDYIQVEEVLRLIRELASGERVVVVATHDTRMLPLADRVVELMPHIAYTEHEPDTVELQAGETLFEQGTMGDCIYVVSEGELEIIRELASGGEEVLKIAGPGDYFGEMGPVFGLPRSATVRALTAATVVGYTVQAFREKLGATGSREIVEHRPLSGDDTASRESD